MLRAVFRKVQPTDGCTAQTISYVTDSDYITLRLVFQRSCEAKCRFCAPGTRKYSHRVAFGVDGKNGVHVHVDDQIHINPKKWTTVELNVSIATMDNLFACFLAQLDKGFNRLGMWLAASPLRCLKRGSTQCTVQELRRRKNWFCSELFSCALAAHGVIEECVPCKQTPQTLFELIVNRPPVL